VRAVLYRNRTTCQLQHRIQLPNLQHDPVATRNTPIASLSCNCSSADEPCRPTHSSLSFAANCSWHLPTPPSAAAWYCAVCLLPRTSECRCVLTCRCAQATGTRGHPTSVRQTAAAAAAATAVRLQHLIGQS
jgi:hypothetical protein